MSIIYQSQVNHIKKKIENLKKLLQRNRKVQSSLKNIKNATKSKIISLQEKMKNQKIYLERPIMKNILSYINLVKKVPHLLKEHIALKNINSRQYQTINNLTTKPNKKSNLKAIKATLNKANSTNPKQIDFIQLAQIQPQTYKNGLQRYKKWKSQTSKQKKQIPFSTNQLTLLFQKYQIYKDNWDKICNFFDGRTFQQLYYRFQYQANKQFKKGRWTLVQNIKLLILLQHLGEKKWAGISKKIKQRSQIQVRQRFCNILDPQISKNTWKKQETQILLKISKQKGFNWSKVVKHPIFSNKTDNIIWRKFRSLMIQKSQKQIIDFVNNRQLAKILIKIKKQKEKTQSFQTQE